MARAGTYARYVPGQKKSAEVAKPVAAKPSSTQLYARYVPPKKSKSSAEAAVAAEQKQGDVTADAVRADDGLKPSEVESNSKKRKRKPTAEDTKNGDHGPRKSPGQHKTRLLEVASSSGHEEQLDSVPEDMQMDVEQDRSDGLPSGVEYSGDGPTRDADQDSDAADNAVLESIFLKYRVTSATKDDTSPTEPADEETPSGTQAVFSKYKKSIALSQKRSQKGSAAVDAREPSPEQELHDLVPLPQPPRAPTVPYKPTFSSLPPWISNPQVVESNVTSPIAKFKLNPKTADNLRKKGFVDALAVQTAVLPLLLPGIANYRGDVCVSAPTGSGKTLSYVLPMVEAIAEKAMTRLRGLIVVPTRELVTQAREVASICAAGNDVKIGTAVGSVALANEQEHLMRRAQRYDAPARLALDQEAERRLVLGYDAEDQMLKDIVDLLPGHVPEYEFTVDILICTPGRLVDHIKSTPGFTLQHVEWLVIDEADRLLDANFQDWVDVVMPSFERTQLPSARQILLDGLRDREPQNRVRKVILSATMTRDLTKLASLKLNRPTLVAVIEPQNEDVDVGNNESTVGVLLPDTLKESAVPVGDGSEKPIQLLQLLNEHFDISATTSSTALVFCSSDDNATRLARLLTLLSPEQESRLGTLTKATTAASRRKTLKAFGKDIKILISTDRASRGLDLDDLTYVINYDIPSSVTSYVHRVGRTARAGKVGEAWTLVTDTEARWFWKSVAKGGEINRGDRVVEKVRLGEIEKSVRERYQQALGELEDAVRKR